MRALEVLHRLMRPATLHCVGLGSGTIVHRISIPAQHALRGPAKRDELSQMPSQELRDVYAWSDGFRLFDLEGYNERSSGWALRLLALREIPDITITFQRTVMESIQRDREEWRAFWQGSEESWMNWFKTLHPFALWGEAGDILMLDHTKAPVDGAAVLRVEFETYCAAPFDADDCEQSWPSFADSLAWLGEDLANRIPSTWRFVDLNGEQFAIDKVEYQNGVLEASRQ